MGELAEVVVRLPPVVYVPCSALRVGDDSLSVDLRPTRDGRLALLVYSALDRLVACCGEEQPWVVLPAVSLETIRTETGFDLLLLDVAIPDGFRRRDRGVIPGRAPGPAPVCPPPPGTPARAGR
jgi:hypothetical protein